MCASCFEQQNSALFHSKISFLMRASSLEQQNVAIFHSKMTFFMRASSLEQQNVEILHSKMTYLMCASSLGLKNVEIFHSKMTFLILVSILAISEATWDWQPLKNGWARPPIFGSCQPLVASGNAKISAENSSRSPQCNHSVRKYSLLMCTSSLKGKVEILFFSFLFFSFVHDKK